MMTHFGRLRLVLILMLMLIMGGLSRQAFAVCEPLAAPESGETVVTVSTLSGIQSAIGSASGPTTIYLASGTYSVTPSAFVNVYKSDITIRSLSGNRDDVVIQGQGMAAGGGTGHGFYITGSNVVIADLTVRDIQNHAIFFNPGSHDNLVHNVRCVDIGEQLLKASGDSSQAPKNNTIVECSLFEYTTTLDDGNDGWYTNGIDLLYAHDWIIRDNIFRNIKHNPALTTTLAGPAILAWQGSTGTLVERNRIIDCDFGISFGNSGGAGVQHDGGIIRNNFIKGYAYTDFGIGMIRAPNAKVLNNTIYAPGGAWPYSIEARFTESTNILIQNNLADEPVWADRDGASATLTANVTDATAAFFQDVHSSDFHLTFDALAALDAGTAHADRLNDFDSQTVADGRPDIGADEFYLRGDVNLDKTIDLTDLTLVLEVLAGQVQPGAHAEADVNGDGRVGAADALFIVQEIEALR